jgi:hypothetical protein
MSRQTPSGPWRPHYWYFTIALRHTTSDLYLTTHNTQNRHTCPGQDPNPQSLRACGRQDWFQKYMCGTKTRITQNCIHVHLVQPVSCYRLSGRLVSYVLIHTSTISLLCYRYRSVVYLCTRRKWGVTNIAGSVQRHSESRLLISYVFMFKLGQW